MLDRGGRRVDGDGTATLTRAAWERCLARWGRRPCMWVACRLHVSHQQCLCLVLRRKLTLRASRRSVALSSSIHGRRSARARRVYACSRGRRKRPLVVCTCVLGRRPCMGCYMACVASMLPEHCRRPHGYGNAFQAALSKPSTLAGTTPLTAMFQVLPPRRWKCWRCSRWKCWPCSLTCSRQRNATPPCEWQRRCAAAPPMINKGVSFLEAAWVAAAEF